MEISKAAALKDFTSLRVGGPAETLIELEPGDSLADVVRAHSGQRIQVLGFGTNCLVADTGLSGVVIINKYGSIDQLSPTGYKVDSGIDWDDFIQKLISDKLWGLEFTSGIPGGVGAAVAGAITAYGHKLADRLVEAEMLDTKTGIISTWPKDKLELGYRTSVLHRPINANQVILNATFELSLEPTGKLEYESALKVARELGVEPDTLASRRQIIMEARRRAGSLLPDIKAGPWTAGSFFKNPTVTQEQFDQVLRFEEHHVSRQRLVEQSKLQGQGQLRAPAALVLLAAGFKRGQTWGQVRLHPSHILKIENIGQATAGQIYAVVQEITGTVSQKLSIELEPEVRILGKFV